MISPIFFLFSFILCLAAFLLIPKCANSLSLIRSTVICYITQLCVGALIALPLSLLSIPVNITTMGVVYLAIAISLCIYIVRSGHFQKYYIDFIDLLTAAGLFIFVLIVLWRVFSFSLNLNYYNSDPGAHFLYAMDIVRSEKLGKMYFAPLYNALFIEMLEPFFSGTDAYKAFILADSLSNYIAGMMFYVLIFAKTRTSKIHKLAPIFTVLYFAGWPLYNYVLGSFVYWGIGITLVTYGIYLLHLYQQDRESRKYIIPLILLTVYSIAMCYMLFIPYAAVLYIAVLLFLSWDYIKSINKRTLCFICVGTACFCLAVFLLAFFTYFHGNISVLFSALSRDGGIHKVLYQDYVYFIPLIIYLLAHTKQTKKISLNMLLFTIYFILVIVSLALCCIGIMSPYYYYKLYYLLWTLCWILTVDAVEYILQEARSWFYGYIIMLTFMFIYPFTPIEDWMVNKGIVQCAYAAFPLYSANGSYVKSPDETRYGESFWELISYVTAQNTSIPLVGTPYDYIYLYWYEPITGYDCEYIETTSLFKQNFIDTKYSKATAFAILKSSDYYSDELDFYPILFENDFAVVYSTIH